MDDDWIEAEMDEYFHLMPDGQYIDPNDYGEVDPETGLTPKEMAWLEYQQAWEDYEANWIGTPYMERRDPPPQWSDFWVDPVEWQQPYVPLPRRKLTKKQKRLVLFIFAGLIIGYGIFFLVLIF